MVTKKTTTKKPSLPTKEVLHIYTRVSSKSQERDGTSLVDQREKGIQTAKRHNMDYKIWNEGGQSSRFDDLGNRPVMDELLDSINKGKIKHVYVWNTDRLSRNQTTWGMIRTNFVRNGVTLYTPSGKQELNDPITNMVVGILSEVSQYDNRLRTIRSRMGKLRKVKENMWMGGPPPYGYRLKEGKLSVDPYESKWLKQIIDWYLEGHSTVSIREELLKNSVLTKRGKTLWSTASITGLFDNTHYIGHYTYVDGEDGTKIECTCPRILTQTKWNRLHNTFESRSYKKGGRRELTTKKHTYLLTGLLVCGHCGNGFYGHKRVNQSQKSYYTCSQKENKNRTQSQLGCEGKRNLWMDKTDEKIWEVVIEVLNQSKGYKELIKTQVFEMEQPYSEVFGTKSKSVNQRKKEQKKLSDLQREYDTIEETIVQRQTDLILTKGRGRGDPTMKRIIEVLQERRSVVQEEIELLNRRIHGEEVSRKWVSWLEKFRTKMNSLDSMDVGDKKEFLKGIVEKISVTNTDTQKHRIEIEFKFPYVGDKLVYKNPSTNKGEYRIVGGKTTKITEENLLKKVYKTRG